ncbi:hypothetical protein ACGTN6_20720, partial [Halomonas sp. THAF12]|uniref:hypothetical protein n=1 Tax=Halomonas sp. B23F22_10 TaxID=3459515 RepID=UPI00373E90DB
MIEFVGPLALAGLAFLPKVRGRMSERKIIELYFKNTGFNLKRNKEVLWPEFWKKYESLMFIRYDYNLPVGLEIKEGMADALSKALGYPVEVSGEKVMSIWIFKKRLPKQWNYKDLLPSEDWKIPIGLSYKGMVWHDFDEIPHMTVAGATRWGKTVFLKVLLT